MSKRTSQDVIACCASNDQRGATRALRIVDVPSRAPSPYRAPVPARKLPPEIDPALLRSSRWNRALVGSTLLIPVWLALTWFGTMSASCGGPKHPETLLEKIVTTVLCALWMVGLLLIRARHRRRQDAALRALTSPTTEDGEESVRIRVGDLGQAQENDSTLAAEVELEALSAPKRRRMGREE